MKKLQLAHNLMLCTILLISGFLCYWVKKLYYEEYNALQKKTDVLLKESVQQIQGERFKMIKDFINPNEIDKVEIRTDSVHGGGMAIITGKPVVKPLRREKGEVEPLIRGEKVVVPATITIRDTPGKPDELKATAIRKKIDSILKKSGHGEGGAIRIVMGTPQNRDSLIATSPDMPPMSFFTQHKVVTEDGVVKADTTVTIKPLAGVVSGLSLETQHKKKTWVDTVAQAKKFFIQINSLTDTIPIGKLDSHYHAILIKEAIPLTYTLHTTKMKARRIDSIPQVNRLATSFIYSGFNNMNAYAAVFESPFVYIAKKLVMPASFALLLITITIISFVVLYRSLLSQRRLAEIKNEFISNITHELKTPIATVNVAIEALRNFDVIDNPQRTREYLDISAIELQRLSLLVDKVLRLSMFEHKEAELQLEQLDIKQLLKDIVNTMRLQFQKAKADVTLHFNGIAFTAQADRLHIMSVVYNLLDNAVKYSKENAQIAVVLSEDEDNITLSVQDNGIGISSKYKDKIFEKFFRVPTNDRHNVKGYGLGLCYVSHIIHQHNGNIAVESEEGKGSTFIVQIPKQHEQD